jgi:hypothetical protein
LVVLGVIGELVLAIVHPEYDSFWGIWGSAMADALIALGVAGEILFARMAFTRQSELQRRSAADLAKAVREAGQLRLDLEKERRLHAGRVVSAEVIENLKALKGVVPWITLIEGTSPESSWFSHDLMMAFIEAGIGIERYEGTRKASGTGLMLYIPGGFSNPIDDPLYKALSPLGLPFTAQSMPLASDADRSAPMLLVGEKPPNFVDPPGWLKRPPEEEK